MQLPLFGDIALEEAKACILGRNSLYNSLRLGSGSACSRICTQNSKMEAGQGLLSLRKVSLLNVYLSPATAFEEGEGPNISRCSLLHLVKQSSSRLLWKADSLSVKQGPMGKECRPPALGVRLSSARPGQLHRLYNTLYWICSILSHTCHLAGARRPGNTLADRR